MALRQTMYGGVCPLGRFGVDIAAGAGCYDSDPVEACISCNFADTGVKGFDLEKICRCPEDMTVAKAKEMGNSYLKTTDKPTKKGFQNFVQENYKPQVAAEPNSSN